MTAFNRLAYVWNRLGLGIGVLFGFYALHSSSSRKPTALAVGGMRYSTPEPITIAG